MVGTNVGNDQASAGYNRTTHNTWAWQNTDCNGSYLYFYPGQAMSSFSGWSFDNKTSSLDHAGQSACGNW